MMVARTKCWRISALTRRILNQDVRCEAVNVTANSNGGNGIEDVSGASGFTDPTDLTSGFTADVLPLAMNGGPTPTHRLKRTSLAIEAGLNSTLNTDQRGVEHGADPDIGAYELSRVHFDYWMEYQTNSNFPNGTFAGSLSPFADYDLDRIANGIEYICGTDPFDSNDRPIIRPVVTDTEFMVQWPHSDIAELLPAEAMFSTNPNDPSDFDSGASSYLFGPTAEATETTRPRRGMINRSSGDTWSLGRLQFKVTLPGE